MSPDAIARAARLGCWSGAVEPEPISGGITNRNYVVRDRGERFFVRIGDDIPVHGVMRFNELAASRAAHAAGVSPEVVHAEAGAMVLRFVEGNALTAEDVRDPRNRSRIVSLIRRVHDQIPRHFQGPGLMFWVFQVVRGYAGTLRASDAGAVAGAGAGTVADLARLLAINDALEAVVGPVRIVFGHNDLLAANFIDDGARLWLIDWDYAGFNGALFDLANLASNNGFAPADEDWLLESYFEAPATDALRRRMKAMMCASLLREAMWSMVSEIHLDIDFDYAAYTAETLARFERAHADFKAF